jgi:hypothetical protein
MEPPIVENKSEGTPKAVEGTHENVRGELNACLLGLISALNPVQHQLHNQRHQHTCKRLHLGALHFHHQQTMEGGLPCQTSDGTL